MKRTRRLPAALKSQSNPNVYGGRQKGPFLQLTHPMYARTRRPPSLSRPCKNPSRIPRLRCRIFSFTVLVKAFDGCRDVIDILCDLLVLILHWYQLRCPTLAVAMLRLLRPLCSASDDLSCTFGCCPSSVHGLQVLLCRRIQAYVQLLSGQLRLLVYQSCCTAA